MAWGAGSYGWGTWGSTAPEFTVTDQDILSLVQVMLLEQVDTTDLGVNWPSGLFTQAQVLRYLNDRVQRFLKETGLTVAVAYQGGQATIRRYNLPSNCIDVRRLAWRSGGAASNPTTPPNPYVEMVRTDAFALDALAPTWSLAGAQSPEQYIDGNLPSLQVEVVLAPNDVGEMELTFVALGNNADGSGQTIAVPDDWMSVIAIGVMADLLGSEGESQDVQRAEYCEMRWNEGVELARLALSGGVS